ncbi:nitroreductase family deazaflavin-dependent oxidoreductase [Williamsia deligens]|uniref:Nitroreductase family deazaflavin-dependent oxidoreductase n=1 Tax=Williamsia deligens TaxID=321325 RepID=A0ABW3GAS9_9NOCA|nr:nitroreductase family deazaflavin-dependent oxidoreductase [Williamsia deligens]MCP2195169.1 deazaflavin-dependent oxidoreductase, nitroreductase family [Williamsia deligens]
MGLLTPIAVRVGAISWMPKLLPVIEKTDMRLQRASGGRVSVLDIAGLPNLVLRVPGRKSGVVRSTPLLCAPRDGDFLIAGSYFGNPKMPAWVHNLRACETAEIVRDGSATRVRWRELDGDDRARAWQDLLDVWPNFRLYEQRTDRVIPVFSLAADD